MTTTEPGEGKPKPEQEQGVVGRLAEKGEEVVSRLREEIGGNPRLGDALHRAMSAKGRIDSASHSALGQLGLAPADEVRRLRGQVEALEQRLAKLEGSGGASDASESDEPTAKISETKKTPTAATKKVRVEADEEEAVSPAAGRALGGGSGRGGSAGGGVGT